MCGKIEWCLLALAEVTPNAVDRRWLLPYRSYDAPAEAEARARQKKILRVDELPSHWIVVVDADAVCDSGKFVPKLCQYILAYDINLDSPHCYYYDEWMKSLFLSLSRPLLRVRSSPYNGIHFFLSLLRNKLNLSLISICCALLQRSRVCVYYVRATIFHAMLRILWQALLYGSCFSFKLSLFGNNKTDCHRRRLHTYTHIYT